MQGPFKKNNFFYSRDTGFARAKIVLNLKNGKKVPFQSPPPLVKKMSGRIQTAPTASQKKQNTPT
jgi:hypothetical protein